MVSKCDFLKINMLVSHSIVPLIHIDVTSITYGFPAYNIFIFIPRVFQSINSIRLSLIDDVVISSAVIQ